MNIYSDDVDYVILIELIICSVLLSLILYLFYSIVFWKMWIITEASYGFIDLDIYCCLLLVYRSVLYKN